MKLLTKEIIKKLEKNPVYDGEESYNPFEKECIVKLFNPIGFEKWYIISADKEDGDWYLYGYIVMYEGGPGEWGYVSLKELEEIELPFGFKIERDLMTKGTLKDMLLRDKISFDETPYVKEKKEK